MDNQSAEDRLVLDALTSLLSPVSKPKASQPIETQDAPFLLDLPPPAQTNPIPTTQQDHKLHPSSNQPSHLPPPPPPLPPPLPPTPQRPKKTAKTSQISTSTGSTTADTGWKGGGEKEAAGPRKRPVVYAEKACSSCKSSHVACDSGRPCQRCIRLNRADTCTDAERKKRGRPSAKDAAANSINSATTAVLPMSPPPLAPLPPPLVYLPKEVRQVAVTLNLDESNVNNSAASSVRHSCSHDPRTMVLPHTATTVALAEPPSIDAMLFGGLESPRVPPTQSTSEVIASGPSRVLASATPPELQPETRASSTKSSMDRNTGAIIMRTDVDGRGGPAAKALMVSNAGAKVYSPPKAESTNAISSEVVDTASTGVHPSGAPKRKRTTPVAGGTAKKASASKESSADVGKRPRKSKKASVNEGERSADVASSVETVGDDPSRGQTANLQTITTAPPDNQDVNKPSNIRASEISKSSTQVSDDSGLSDILQQLIRGIFNTGVEETRSTMSRKLSAVVSQGQGGELDNPQPNVETSVQDDVLKAVSALSMLLPDDLAKALTCTTSVMESDAVSASIEALVSTLVEIGDSEEADRRNKKDASPNAPQARSEGELPSHGGSDGTLSVTQRKGDKRTAESRPSVPIPTSSALDLDELNTMFQFQ